MLARATGDRHGRIVAGRVGWSRCIRRRSMAARSRSRAPPAGGTGVSASLVSPGNISGDDEEVDAGCPGQTLVATTIAGLVVPRREVVIRRIHSLAWLEQLFPGVQTWPSQAKGLARGGEGGMVTLITGGRMCRLLVQALQAGATRRVLALPQGIGWLEGAASRSTEATSDSETLVAPMRREAVFTSRNDRGLASHGGLAVNVTAPRTCAAALAEEFIGSSMSARGRSTGMGLDGPVSRSIRRGRSRSPRSHQLEERPRVRQMTIHDQLPPVIAARHVFRSATTNGTSADRRTVLAGKWIVIGSGEKRPALVLSPTSYRACCSRWNRRALGRRTTSRTTAITQQQFLDAIAPRSVARPSPCAYGALYRGQPRRERVAKLPWSSPATRHRLGSSSSGTCDPNRRSAMTGSPTGTLSRADGRALADGRRPR